ncbi:MAG: hypothetical protein WEA61_01040 [Anaerolineales bacterium]
MMRIFVPSKSWPAVILILLLATGCNFPGIEQVTQPSPATITPSSPAAQSDVPAAPEAAPLLPHSVYFLSERSGSRQVWRLEGVGASQAQVTHEANDVLAFDVSRIDGSVAFVVDNQLYLVDADGSERRLMVDNASADIEAAAYFYTQRISDPRISPDGRYLAYAYDGLWIVDLTTNQAIHPLQNQMEATENETLAAEKYYAPLAWAPDSQQLLLSVGGSETSTLAFWNPAAVSSVSEVESDTGLVCCQAAWAPDSTSALVASPYAGLIEAGLWRYDALAGVETRLLEAERDGLFQFAGWPLQLADGELQYFYASTAEIPEGDVPLYMVRSSGDGVSGRTQLRSDAFSNIAEALWAEDGALALVVQARLDGGLGGSVVLAFSDGRQLQLLLDSAFQIRWGP